MNVQLQRHLFSFIPASVSCGDHVCLSWKIRNGNLTITCKTNKLLFTVSFYHPLEEEQAFCTLTTCHTSLSNSSISQNKTTRETLLTIPMDTQYDGWWSCKYGATNGEADVEVTLISTFITKSDQGVTGE